MLKLVHMHKGFFSFSLTCSQFIGAAFFGAVYSEKGNLFRLYLIFNFLDLPKINSYIFVLILNIVSMIILTIVKTITSSMLAYMAILLMGSTMYSQDVII